MEEFVCEAEELVILVANSPSAILGPPCTYPEKILHFEVKLTRGTEINLRVCVERLAPVVGNRDGGWVYLKDMLLQVLA